MHMPPHVIEKLQELGLVTDFDEQMPFVGRSRGGSEPFRPSGLNDDRRVDMTDQPFFAVDSVGPKEIDDAIRVRPLSAGKVSIEVAVADAGQLHTHEPIVETAIQRRWSRYTRPGKRSALMLPNNVLSALELDDDKARRALVVSQPFTRDMQPIGNLEILPARVQIKRLTMVGLARSFSQRSRQLEPIARAAEGLGINTRLGERHGRTPEDLANIGTQTVRAFMIFANRGLAAWSNERQVPVLNRAAIRLDKGSVYAYFTHQNDLHAAVLESGKTLYMQGTSPLRRANDLVSMINIGVALGNASPDYPYPPERLEEIGDYLLSERIAGSLATVQAPERSVAS